MTDKDTTERRARKDSHLMTEFKLNLQLFADGGDGGTAAVGEGGAEQGENAATPTAPGDNAEAPTAEDREAQYAQFKKDFKAEYDREVQSVIKERLKKANAQNTELNERVKAYAPLLERIAKKYNVAADDIDGIINAFDNDDSNYEEEAYQRNMTVEAVKQFHQIEWENERLKQADEERQRQALYAQWDAEAAELTQIYPNFDINVEMENPQFCQMMNARVPLKTAYEVIHHEELIAGAQQFAVQKANEKLANAVASNKSRPSENGLSSNAPAVTKVDIAHLSPEQMREYKQRALAGEVIDFKS